MNLIVNNLPQGRGVTPSRGDIKITTGSPSRLSGNGEISHGAHLGTSTFPCELKDLKSNLENNIGMQWETSDGTVAITLHSIKWVLNNVTKSQILNIHHPNTCFIYNKPFVQYLQSQRHKKLLTQLAARHKILKQKHSELHNELTAKKQEILDLKLQLKNSNDTNVQTELGTDIDTNTNTNTDTNLSTIQTLQQELKQKQVTTEKEILILRQQNAQRNTKALATQTYHFEKEMSKVKQDAAEKIQNLTHQIELLKINTTEEEAKTAETAAPNQQQQSIITELETELYQKKLEIDELTILNESNANTFLETDRTTAAAVVVAAAAEQKRINQATTIKKLKNEKKSLKSLVKSLKTETERASKALSEALNKKSTNTMQHSEEMSVLKAKTVHLETNVLDLKKELDFKKEQIINLERYKTVAKEREQVAKNRLTEITELEERVDTLTTQVESLQTVSVKEQEHENENVGVEKVVEQVVEQVIEQVIEKIVEKVEEVKETTEEVQQEMQEDQQVFVALEEQHASILLKQAIVQFMVTKNVDVRSTIAPVIIELLHLSSEEQNKVLEAVQLEAAAGVLSSVSDWFSPY